MFTQTAINPPPSGVSTQQSATFSRLRESTSAPMQSPAPTTAPMMAWEVDTGSFRYVMAFTTSAATSVATKAPAGESAAILPTVSKHLSPSRRAPSNTKMAARIEARR